MMKGIFQPRYGRVSVMPVAGILFAGMCALTARGGEIRVFKNNEGKSLKASYEGVTDGKVTLRREDGKSFELPISSLSAEDQTYISAQAGRAEEEAAKLNQAAGLPLAEGGHIIDRNAAELAKSLRLQPESTSKYGKSWRLYASFVKGYRLFGAMPYSVALYSGEDGRVASISLVYANKGDFGSTAGMGQDHFGGTSTAGPTTLAKAMDDDESMVANSLAKVLGEARVQRFGEGATRRKVSRWDWNGTAFILSKQDEEYVALAILPSATADLGGRSTRVGDTVVKSRLLDSIVKSPNGDVYLSQIPMVDQGPKGYCVPATFERAMRTMGLDADMYLLAMVGQSGMGGGTSVELLLQNVRSAVYSKGRRTKEETLKELRIRDFKRYIDQGVPVIWAMCSMDDYNEVANKNTATRASVTDWKAHAQSIAALAAPYSKKEKPADNHHVCMIIGYNEATGEVAVSDSWGPSYELRWVPLPVADWVSMGSIFMILP